MNHTHCTKCGSKLVQIEEIKNGFNPENGREMDSYFSMRCPNYKFSTFFLHDKAIIDSLGRDITWHPYI